MRKEADHLADSAHRCTKWFRHRHNENERVSTTRRLPNLTKMNKSDPSPAATSRPMPAVFSHRGMWKLDGMLLELEE